MLIVFLSPLFGKDYGNLKITKVVSVYDGDTIKVNIDNLHPILGESVSIRILGIDAPEIRTKDLKEKARARKARDFLADLITSSSNIELKRIERGKYFRILADLYLDGVSAANLMLQSGYAKEYYGGAR